MLERRTPFRDFVYTRKFMGDREQIVSISGIPVFDDSDTFVGSRTALRPIWTWSFVPSKVSALPVPSRPVTYVGPLTSVPVLPFPDASPADVPVPSLNCQNPITPAGNCPTSAVVKVKSVDVVRFPDASLLLTRKW